MVQKVGTCAALRSRHIRRFASLPLAPARCRMTSFSFSGKAISHKFKRPSKQRNKGALRAFIWLLTRFTYTLRRVNVGLVLPKVTRPKFRFLV